MATRSWYTPGGYVTANDALINEWFATGIGYFSEETALDVVPLNNIVRTYVMSGGAYHSVDDAVPNDYFVPGIGYLTERSIVQILPGVSSYENLAHIEWCLIWEPSIAQGVTLQSQKQQNLWGYPVILWTSGETPQSRNHIVYRPRRRRLRAKKRSAGF